MASAGDVINLTSSIRRRNNPIADLHNRISTRGTGIIRLRQNAGPSRVKLTIHHQSPGIELASPVYACDGAKCYLSPDQRVDVDFTTQAGFNIDLDQYESTGTLIYKLQRKNMDQSNEEAISSEEETTCTQLLINWRVDSSKEFHVVSHLVEHDKGHVWNGAVLMRLAENCELYGIQHDLIEDTWLMHDNTALMTKMNVTREEECYKLEMTLSETSIKDDTRRPWYIDINT
jgi:hypothetical protein